MTSLTPIEDVSVPARGKNMSSNLPTELVLELSGHQGPVRAVRFNSKFEKTTDHVVLRVSHSHFPFAAPLFNNP